LCVTSKIEDDSSCIKEFKTKVSAALQRRWGLKYLDPSEIPVLASAVDPRFRNLKFLSDELKGDGHKVDETINGFKLLVHIPPVQSPRKKTKLHGTFFLLKKVMMILVMIVKRRLDSISWRK